MSTKRQFLTMIFASVFVVSGCNALKNPQSTSSARAAYGDTSPDFKANKKQNQKRKKTANRKARAKKAKDEELYFHGRPY